MDHFMDLVLIT